MAKRDHLFQRLYKYPYGYLKPFDLFDSTKNSQSFLQRLRLQVKIPAHNGCVNSICWNESGRYILSGSDDQHICVTDSYTQTVLTHLMTGHRSNIFSAKFLPGGDNKIVSCSGDGVIIYTDLESPETSLSNKFDCHFGTAYEITTVPNEPNTFLSCGEDGTVRWFDIRTKTSCSRSSCREDVLINCYRAVTGLSVNGTRPYQLAVGCSDASVRIFDRRMICTAASGGFKPKSGLEALMANFTVPSFTSNHRITSLAYSQDGQEMLVSYSSEFIYLFDVRCSFQEKPKILGGDSDDPCNKSSRSKTYSSRPLMKRLRVRGDWSDTGPNARPESENRGEQQQPRSLHASLVQRMSDVLTTMYNQRTRPQPIPVASSSSSHSEDSEMDDAEEHAEAGGDRSQVTSTNENVGAVNEGYDMDESMIVHGECTITRITHTSGEEENVLPSTSVTDCPSLCPQLPSSSTSALKEEAINLSLRNIKQEIAKSAASNGMKEKSVITVDSLPVNSSSLPEGDDNNGANNLESKSTVTVQSIDSSILNNTTDQSVNPTTDCDNLPTEDSCSTAKTNCDDKVVATTDNRSESNENMDESHPEIASSHSSAAIVPEILVAPSSELSSIEVHPSVDRNQDRVTVMMEMNTNWNIDSEEEEEERDETSSNTRRKERSKEELEKEEAERMNEVPHPEVKKTYYGHRNARTMIKEATFWGDNFVMSGSDCGHIFIWDRDTTDLVMIMEADHHVVNCLQPHPFDPILASSGIDYDIKLWAPLREDPFFDEEKATELMKRNRVMLEETRDTITVPASFMIRMLASLNHVTSGSGWRRMARHLREGVRRNR